MYGQSPVKLYLGFLMILIAVLLLWTTMIAPSLTSVMADWQFLHAARMQVEQQSRQQAQPKPAGQAEAPPPEK